VLVCAALLAWAARGWLDDARVLGKRASAARRQMHTAIAEHIGSMKTAKSYGATDRHAEVFARLSHDLRDVSLELTTGETDLQQGLEFGSTALLGLIVFVSFQFLDATPEQMLVLLFIFARMMPRLVTMYSRLQNLSAVAPLLDGVARLEQECLTAAEPEPSEACDIAVARDVRFDAVSFSYRGRAVTPALSGVNLEIAVGLTTAIVGPSGAGKSTFTDLLIGLLSPTGGQILIDGVPLTPERLAGWRRHISYVPQETFLFHDTVRANLVWARPGSTDDDLWQALRLAAAEEFVAALPTGLDTIVGERGVLLSGGERQRLSLARALLRRPRVLVLDEATSSLDSETERRVQYAIEGLHREMTIVIVTHRLSMISGADVIHVLDGGRLAESGGWDDLLARENGRFADLCRAQGITQRPVPLYTALEPSLQPLGT
jgi:ATP-binding cassette subfamily C protein